MSLPFPQDTSVQLSYSSFPFLTPALDNYATSNYVISNSNILNTKINTKQDTLTAATNLLGVGSSISALDYNKITINKPSFFPADWGSTIANKPTIYTQTEVNNLLSAKEQILTFNSPLTRITNTIGINLNSYTPFSALLSSNFATYTGLNSCNYITNSTNSLTNYYNTSTSDGRYTQSNFTPSFTQLNSCNYITNSTNSLTNYYNKSTSDGRYTQSNFTPSFTQLNSCNYITNATTGLTNYTRTGLDGAYLLKSGGSMSGALTTPNITLGGTSGKINVVDDYHYIDFNQSTDTTTIQEYGTIKFNIGLTKTTKAYVNSTGLTATAFYGDGANITNVPYSSITGKPTNFQSDWTTTIINKPTNFQSDWTTTIINKPTNFQADWTTTIINKPSIYTQSEITTFLSQKENVLTFNSPLTRTTNAIGINLNSYPTFTQLNSCNYASTGSFLALSGGTMTGQLQISTSAGNNPLYITSSATNANNCINIKNNSTYNAYLGVGGSAFGGNYQNNFFIESASGAIVLNTNGRTSGSPPNFLINTSGDISIGSATTNSKLNIYSTTQTQPKISLTGIEYYTGANTNNDGVGLLLGVNRTDNRQLFICDTAKTAINTTNSILRIGVGGATGAFIDSTATDGLTRMVLNIGGNAFNCQANSYGSMNKILKFHNVQVADDRATMEGLIFNEGAMMGGTFAGDSFITGYWGVAVLLNSGGFANGYGGGNNGRSYEAGWSAFTINSRNSTSATTFDKRLMTMFPTGTSYFYGQMNVSATDSSYIKCGANANGYYLNVGATSSASSTMFDSISSGVWTSFTGALHLNPSTASNKTYINFYNTSANCSIGNATGDAKLHVGSGTASTGNIYQRLLSLVLGDGTGYQTLSDVCAIFDSSVWTKSKFTTSSDERIKKNIQDINDDGALQKILLIQPKTYEYIDKLDKGNDIVYGFIAQQIKEVIPEAVKIEKCIIPNIYKFCNYINDVISLTPEQINKLKINDEIEIIIEDDNNKRLVKIIEINDVDNTIKINESLNIIKTTNKTKEEEVIKQAEAEEAEEVIDEIIEADTTPKECFVYGSKVDDFHTLDKTYIFTLNVCATQELYKIIQLQEERIRILEEKLASF